MTKEQPKTSSIEKFDLLQACRSGDIPPEQFGDRVAEIDERYKAVRIREELGQMITNKRVKKAAKIGLVALAAAGLALLIGCAPPNIEKKKDLTGDGIEDVLLNVSPGYNNGRWLFIGKKEGGYISALEKGGQKGPRYFETGDGQIYFSDGEVYRLSPKEKLN